MFLGWNLQDRRDRSMIVLEDMSNIIGDVLVNENDAHIVARRKAQESFFDELELGILFDNQKVGSCSGSMAYASEKKSRDGVL